MPRFHFFQAKTANELKESGESFGEQGGAGLTHDDGGKRAGEQPESIEQTFKTGGHAFEQSQWGGANDVPAPEDDAGCNGENSGDDDIDNAPLVISLGHSFSHDVPFFSSHANHSSLHDWFRHG